jgi:hypothetical protein
MMRQYNDLPVVYLCRDAVDFRKGINGLAVLFEDLEEFTSKNSPIFWGGIQAKVSGNFTPRAHAWAGLVSKSLIYR